MMVAHSLRGEVFGPAQGLHGATYVVDATFRARGPGRGRHRRRHRRAPPRRCTRSWPTLTYRNLDDEPALAGLNTTTEVLARVIADRLAARVHAGALGRPAATWPARRHAARVATSPGRATSARCDAALGDVRRARPASTTPRGPAAATSTTGGCCDGLRAAGWRSPSGRSPAPGRARRPPTWLRWRALLDGAARRRAGPRRRAGRVGGGRGARAAVGAAAARRPACTWLGGVPSPADGERAVLAAAAAVVTTSDWTRRLLLDRYALPPTGCTSPRPGVDRRAGAPADRRRRPAALRGHALARSRGRTCCWRRWPSTSGPWRCTFVGPLDRDPDFVAALHRRAAAAGIADRLRWCAGAHRARRSRASTRGRGPAGRPSRARDLRHGGGRGAGAPGCRCCGRRRRGSRGTGVHGARRPGPARAARRTPARSPPRWRAGSPTPACGTGCAAPPWSGGGALPGWATTEQRLLGVLAAVGGEPDPVRTRATPVTRDGGRRG